MKCLMGGAALRIKVRVGPSYISIEHARRVLVTEQDGPPLSPAHDHIDLPTVALSKDLAEGIELSFASVRVLVGILYRDHRVISRSSMVRY
jgi:hypothetical protein